MNTELLKTRFNYKYTESKNDGINRAVRITNPILKTLGGKKSDIRIESYLYTDAGNIYKDERIDWNEGGLGVKVTDISFIGSIKIETFEHRY